jgi:hypothetical protein
VPGMIPRRRRKAGSGPPATALIAWIGTDPYLRSAVAQIQSKRRETDLSQPANTAFAKATAAACFIVVCGTVLSITAIISDGLLLPLLPNQVTAPPVFAQSNAGTPSPCLAPDQLDSYVRPIAASPPVHPVPACLPDKSAGSACVPSRP